MGRIFNIVIFILLLCLVVIANGSFFGVSLNKGNENAKAESSFELSQEHKVIYTMPTAKDISGYGGAIPMAIAIDENNTILEIEILKNSEDPNYLGEVIEGKYLKNWEGKTLKEASTLNVDAVSGATLSSTAIAKSIKLTAQTESKGSETENIEIEETKESESGINYAQILKIFGLIFVITTGVLAFYFPAKASKYRVYLLISNIFILGIWQGAMLSVFKISNWLINGIPNLLSYFILVIFLLSILIPFFTKKNFYCMYLCPFGASQELASRALRVKNQSITKLFFKGLEYARMVMLLACFVLLILGLGGNIAMLEPFSAFNPQMASKVAIAIFVLSLILSIFVPRAWCRYFCPCGALLDLFKLKKK